MPIRILSPDAAGRVCGTVKSTILDRLAARPGTPDVTVVPVSNFPDFRFNPELRAIKGPWVMVDFLEYGAGWRGERTHLIGKPDRGGDGMAGSIHVLQSAAKEWEAFEVWAWDNPPALYLKRELAAKHVSPRVRPIDWTCGQPAPPVQTRAEFGARPIEVFHCWGYSNPLRTRLHADIFEAMGTRGISADDDLNGVHNFIYHTPGARRWLSAFVPWWRRHPMAAVMAVQQMAKISVSLPGFGLKCFRHAEAPVGAVMAMTDDPLAWSFPWECGVNCIAIPRVDFFPLLEEWTRADWLYDMYRASQETIDRYRPDRYVDEYLLPLIREAVG